MISLPDLHIVEPICAVFRKRLKAEGLKYTPERARVLDAIVRREGAFGAEEIVEDLRDIDHRVSKATVYRTLKLLHESGVVQRIMLGDETPRYHLVYGSKGTDILVRMDTGEVREVEIPGLAEAVTQICAKLGLQLVGRRVQIYAEKKV